MFKLSGERDTDLVMRNLFDSFYFRLCTAIFLLLIGVTVLLLMLIGQYTSTRQLQVEQQLHQDLARELVKGNRLFAESRFAESRISELFHSMMILGPRFKFYVLGPDGRLLNYSADSGEIKRFQVDIDPIESYLLGTQRYPILAEDPRRHEGESIFSVAPIYVDKSLKGYLYIIINPEADQSSLFWMSEPLTRTLLINIGLLVMVYLIALLATFRSLTAPLRRLNNEMTQFQSNGLSAKDFTVSDWAESGRGEVEKLGVVFSEMVQHIRMQYNKIKDVDDLRRELLAHISHDFRTPLAALQGYLETWQISHRRLPAEAQEDLISAAYRNGEQVKRLIEQLFELAHLEGTEIKVSPEPFVITELAYDVISKFRLAADEKGIQLSVLPKGQSIGVVGDIEKVERVITNLVDNALRHCEPGDRVYIACRAEEDGSVNVRVCDTGSGIPESELTKIFEPHYRATNARRGSSVNSGLGLAITKKLLAVQKVDIEVVSKAGAGTYFSFSLPGARPSVDASEEATEVAVLAQAG